MRCESVMIEIANLRRQEWPPHYLADLTIQTEEGDLLQTRCSLDQTDRNLLGTLLYEHLGDRRGDELLVGDCGDPECCGVDFAVLHRNQEVELRWPDPVEWEHAIARFAREHPHQGTFPRELKVPERSVLVPLSTYAEEILRLAAMYLKTRQRAGDADEKTRKWFEMCRGRYGDLLDRVQQKTDRSDPWRFEEAPGGQA